MASKSGKGSDRTHKPHGSEHYSPRIEKRIEVRAVRALTMAGVPSTLAYAIVKSPIGANKG